MDERNASLYRARSNSRASQGAPSASRGQCSFGFTRNRQSHSRRRRRSHAGARGMSPEMMSNSPPTHQITESGSLAAQRTAVVSCRGVPSPSRIRSGASSNNRSSRASSSASPSNPSTIAQADQFPGSCRDARSATPARPPIKAIRNGRPWSIRNSRGTRSVPFKSGQIPKPNSIADNFRAIPSKSTTASGERKASATSEWMRDSLSAWTWQWITTRGAGASSAKR